MTISTRIAPRALNLGGIEVLRAADVFTPGSFPEHSYVQRTNATLEQTLADSLETPGLIVSISGPSKSGKTVLVERVVGKDMLIPVPGASIKSPADVWSSVLDWMDAPSSTTSTQTYGGTMGLDATAKGSVGIPVVAQGELGAALHGGFNAQLANASTAQRGGLQQVVREIAASPFVVLIDDFHYMSRDLQAEVAKSIKEAVRQKIKIVTAAVTHRGDDVLRANPDLRGRLRSIDLDYWNDTDLKSIAKAGFDALNFDPDPATIAEFVRESAGSPQLMQLLCLESCFVANLREKHEGMVPAVINFDASRRSRVFEQTSAHTDHRSLAAVLDAGPPTRGTKRSVFSFGDGTSGDVYRAVLKAIASDPPQLSFSYEQLLERTASICVGESPVGSSVTSTCVHMSRLAGEKLPQERALEWDESTQVFDVPDPYFLFYLRWSDRLKATQRPPRAQVGVPSENGQ
jgi:hypothetical protein